jgi:hypothetical protein
MSFAQPEMRCARLKMCCAPPKMCFARLKMCYDRHESEFTSGELPCARPEMVFAKDLSGLFNKLCQG